MTIVPGNRSGNVILYNGSESELSSHKQKFYRGLANKDILDLGCGTGGAARFLQPFGNRVSGINSSEEEAVIARQHMQQVLVADLDSLEKLPFTAGSFDVVLLGDILEHLKYPYALLTAVKAVLRPGGCIYVSLPNVANVVVRLNLLFGRFQYEDSGIMDVTHLRFFTRASACELVEAAGFTITRQDYSNWNWGLLPQSILRVIRMRRVELMIRNGLTRLLPGLFATQIMLVATLK